MSHPLLRILIQIVDDHVFHGHIGTPRNELISCLVYTEQEVEHRHQRHERKDIEKS